MNDCMENENKIRTTSVIEYLIDKYGISEVKEKVLPLTTVTEPNHENE